MEERHISRKCGKEHRVSMPPADPLPSQDLQVSSPRSCLTHHIGFSWRLYHTDTTDETIVHWRVFLPSVPLSYPTAGGGAERSNPLVTWLVSLETSSYLVVQACFKGIQDMQFLARSFIETSC